MPGRQQPKRFPETRSLDRRCFLALVTGAWGAPQPPAGSAPQSLGGWNAAPNLREVHALCFDRNGHLILVDSLGSRVQRYDKQGRLQNEVGNGPGDGPGQFAGPRDAKVNRAGEIFVSDANHGRIQVFTAEGAFLRQFGSQGSGPGQMLRAHALDFGPDGRLFVADVDNSRISVFDSSGKFLYAWGRAGKGPGLFQAPHGLGVDPEGNVFVSNYYGPCQKFTPEGRFLYEFGAAPFRGWIHFHSMAADGKGNVYLAARNAQGRNAVVMFDNQGRFVAEWSASAGRGIKAVAVDATGLVYLAVDAADYHGVEVYGLG